jgi:hypothetical protein
MDSADRAQAGKMAMPLLAPWQAADMAQSGFPARLLPDSLIRTQTLSESECGIA